MKFIQLLLLLLLPVIGFSQIYDKPGNYGLQYKRVKIDSALNVPVLTDTVFLSPLNPKANIIYVESPTGMPDTGFWVYELGRYTRLTTQQQLNSEGKMFGTMYQASSWSNFDDFTSNFSDYSIDGDGNIQFTGGDNSEPAVLSWDYTSNLTAWQVTTQIIVDTKDATSYGIAQGMWGTGEQTLSAHSDWSTFAHLNLTDHSTQGGKIYIVSGRNPNQIVPIDSSVDKLTFSVGDTIVVRTKWEYTTMYIYVTNITTGSKVQHEYNFYTAVRYNTGKYSVWPKSPTGGFTLDSLDINSETVKDVDIIFIGDSKTSCISVTSIGKCWSRLVQNHVPNSNIHAAVGDHIGDAINSFPEIRNINAKQAIINLYYNDLWAFPADTVIELYARLVDSCDKIGMPSFKMTPQDYPPVGFPEIRARYDSFRTFLYDTYDSVEIIDAFFDMEKCGTPCSFFNAHPSDSGHFVIANVVINSKKLAGATELHEQIGRQVGDSLEVIRGLITTPGLNDVLTESNTSALSATVGGLTVSNLTAGSILFAGTSGLISQDNSNLFFDNTNNYLGIGTATPATTLHVYKTGGGIIAKFQSNQTNDIGFVEFLNTSGTRVGYYGYGGAVGSNWLAYWNTSNAGIVLGTNNTARVLINADGTVKINNIPTVTTYDSVLVVEDNVPKKVLFAITGSATLDFPNTATNENSDLTISVPGAVVGDVVAIGHSLTTQGTFEGDVSATDVVTIRFHNTAAGAFDPPSDTFKVKVFK